MKTEDYEHIVSSMRTADDVERLVSEGYDRRMLTTMYRQTVNRKVKKRYHVVRKKSAQMLRDWSNGESFCSIAERMDFPPMLTAMMIFQEHGIPKKTFWEYVRDPSKLDSEEAAEELREATAKDLVYSPQATQDSAELGKWGEGLLWNWLDGQDVDYMTEADERLQKEYSGQKTPDCLLAEPMEFEGRKIYWVESKASFGDAVEFRYNCRNQLVPYTEIFGPGVVVYWTGHLDGLECPEGVILEDIGILGKKLGKWEGERTPSDGGSAAVQNLS